MQMKNENEESPSPQAVFLSLKTRRIFLQKTLFVVVVVVVVIG